jgi:hypothetical protein
MIRLGCENLISRGRDYDSGADTFECVCNAGTITPFASGGMECPRTCAYYSERNRQPEAALALVGSVSPFESAKRPAA